MGSRNSTDKKSTGNSGALCYRFTGMLEVKPKGKGMELGPFVIRKETVKVIADEHISIAESELGAKTIPDIVEVIIVVVMFPLFVVIGIECLLRVTVHQIAYVRSHPETESVVAAFAQPIVGAFLMAKCNHGHQRGIDVYRRKFALPVAGIPGIFTEDYTIGILSHGHFIVAELEIIPAHASTPVEGKVVGNPGVEGGVDADIP